MRITHRQVTGPRGGPPSRRVIRAACLGCLIVSTHAFAASSLQDELAELLHTVRPPAPGINAAVNAPAHMPAGPPQVSVSEDGFVRYLSAATGRGFPVVNPMAGQPAITAKRFLNQHGRLFGINSPAVDFTTLKLKARNNRHYVRFQQTYAGLPVFAAQVTIQLNAQEAVECVFSDIERNTKPLDDKRVSTLPNLTANQAAEQAKALMAGEAAGVPLATTPAQLAIFSPVVVGEVGEPRLVWDLVVSSTTTRHVRERVLVDGHTGEMVYHYPLTHWELQRVIFDYTRRISVTNENGTVYTTWNPVRSEGEPPAAEPQVNAAYAFIGATYNFYLDQHGRTNWYPFSPRVEAWVRYCPSDNQCPWVNAEYDSYGTEMHFGEGFAVDDVVAHEYTHGITDFESNLLYRNASGAMNEAFSDIWGEFVDLTFPSGNDSPSVRWLHGEDLPGGANRNMKNPPAFNNPDRLNSPLYVPPPAQPSQDNDYGGVHSNSGVLNKLCYLLTDGDYFNGYSIAGMGIARIADLFYEVNANLLQSAPDWGDLYAALRQATINLAWTKPEQENLCRACLAVEIALRPQSLYVNKGAIACPAHDGSPECGLFDGPFLTIAQGVNAICPGDNLWVRVGSYNEQLTIARTLRIRPYDGPVTIGR
jgi:bacillolysin